MDTLEQLSPLRSHDDVARALAALQAGRPVLVWDDSATTGEGNLVVAAELATAETLAFVVRHTSGLICVALTGADCERLDLPAMVGGGPDARDLDFRVTVDLTGPGTGISATDRAATVAALGTAGMNAEAFTRPGHVLPVRAAAGGIATRPGPAEASVDMAEMAGLRPAGVFAAVVSREQPCEMAHGPELRAFAIEHGLEAVSLGQLRTARHASQLHRRHAEQLSSGPQAGWLVHRYSSSESGSEHIALISGLGRGRDVPVCIYTGCLTRDLLGATCQCGASLDAALRHFARTRFGVVLHVRHSGVVSACDSPFEEAGVSMATSFAVHDTTEAILADLGITTARFVRADEIAGGSDHALTGTGSAALQDAPTDTHAAWGASCLD